jgi:hypothetical protein
MLRLNLLWLPDMCKATVNWEITPMGYKRELMSSKLRFWSS